MGRDESKIPTGRVRRAAQVGRLAGGQTARQYATKAANLTRDEEARRVAAEKRQIEAAEQIFDVLGQMKGAAMKVGQVASFIDTGGLPPEFQERLQIKLAELRDAAPRVSFKEMKKLMESGLDAPLDEVFSEFEEEAVAAASIGQVYRARLADDDREVAVKVQYPGVASAVRADLQNLGIIMRVAKRIAPGMDAKAMATEIRGRLTDELDYEHEAQNQRAFARAWKGHPFIYIPDVVTSLSTEKVLVSEWIDGVGFEEVREMDDATRDRFGEIVFRFFFGSLYRHGHFSGDPHPGNYQLLPDGRVAFLDYGMTKRLSPERVADEVKAIRLALEEDADGLHAHMAAMGFYDPEDDKVSPEAVLAHFRAVAVWYLEDRELTLDRKTAGQILIDFGDPRSRHWELMRRGTAPAESMLSARMQALTLGVLGQLECTANWHRIAREWLFDEPPSTPLGEQETEYFGGGRRTAA
ncbi:MAG: AarF/ABC1/UbiB kinase family protein [Actinomycetota bacterium]|nr:AarF/ABC1/UbiB kinase family protein [Actinomycetota bacterium]